MLALKGADGIFPSDTYLLDEIPGLSLEETTAPLQMDKTIIDEKLFHAQNKYLYLMDKAMYSTYTNAQRQYLMNVNEIQEGWAEVRKQKNVVDHLILRLENVTKMIASSIAVLPAKRFAIPSKKFQRLHSSSSDCVLGTTNMFLKFKSDVLDDSLFSDLDTFLNEREAFHIITETPDDSSSYKLQYSCTCSSYMHYKACSHSIAYGILTNKMDVHPKAMVYFKPQKQKPGRPKKGNCYTFE